MGCWKKKKIHSTQAHEVKQVKFQNGYKTAKLVLVNKMQRDIPEQANNNKTKEKQKQKNLTASLLPVGNSNETPEFINKLLSDEFLGKVPPKVLISVTGAAKNYKMEEDLKQVFCLGLINVAKSATAWIVSGGTDTGVMWYVGTAKQKSITNVPTIGFASLNKLINQDQFSASIIEYDPIPNKADSKNFVNLNENHTHFVLVSDGEEIIIRADFEDYMHQHYKVPVCLVVVNGEGDTLKTVAAAVVRDFAIVIIEGTGQMADAIARELRKKRNQPYEHLKTMELDIKQQGYMEMIISKQSENYPTLYSVTDSEPFDLQILKAICTNAADGLTQKLKLAVECNSGEFVNYLLESKKSEITTYLADLNTTLQLAIYLDRPDILRILIEKGAKICSVDLRVLYTRQKDNEFTRDSEIERYYPFCKTFTNFMKHSKAEHVAPLESFFTRDEIKFIQDIFMAANPVFSKYINSLATKLNSDKSQKGKKNAENSEALSGEASSSASVGINDGGVSLEALPKTVSESTMSKFEKVRYIDVMLWAILTGKVELAKVCWEKTQEPVKSSLLAAGLCKNVAKWMVNDHEIYLKAAEWFEAVAVDLLEKLKYDDVKMILTHKPPDFGYSAVEIAVKTESKNFVANRHVQRYMDECLYTDKHGSILPGTDMFLVIMCIFLPFLQHLVYTKSDYTRYRGVYKPPKKHRGKWYHFYVLPFTKFWTNTICYLGYLSLLAYVLVSPNQCRSEICFWEYMLWLWMFGYALEEVHQLKVEKWQYFRYFSNRMDILILMLQACYVALSISGYLTPYQQHTDAALIILIVTTIISYVRLLDAFTISSELGPLYFVLLKIFWDVLKWLLLFVLFALSFQISFMALNPGSGHEMGSLYIILGDYQDTINEMSTGFGRALVSVYAIIANIMLLNLLIAMMGDTFTKVRENADKEWKFARYDLITNYRATSFHPPPFNLIVHPYKMVLRTFRARSEIKKLPEDPEQLKNLMKYVRNSYIEAKKSENAGDKMVETLKTMNTKLDMLLPKESKISIGVLVVLKLSDGAENGKEFTILTTHPRLYGVEFTEIPVGVLEGNLLELFAAIDVRQEHLTALTKQSVHFFAGNCIRLFYYRRDVTDVELNRIRNKLTGATDTNRIGLKVVPLDDVWEIPDAKTITALYYYNKLVGKIK